jgi:hypothetical protein
MNSIKYKRILKLSFSLIIERKLNFVGENTEFQMNLGYSIIETGIGSNHKLKLNFKGK